MAQSPDEKTYVEIPFIEQLKGMGWDHIEGDIDVPYLTERESFRDVLLTGRLRDAIKKINLDDEGMPWLDDDRVNEVVRISELGHRWASCGRNGVVNFNWRSVMAPVWVFDYILVHEMVHMIERGHTDRFWHLVARVIPDYEEHARWLNENGADLDL